MKLSIVFTIISMEECANVIQSVNCIIQTLKGDDYEIIIISDFDFEFKMFKDVSNIHIVINKTPIGIFKSRQKSIKLAKGKYISFVNSNIITYVSDLTFIDDENDYDIIRFNGKIEDNNRNHISIQNDLLSEDDVDEYVNLNPITSRFILKKYYNPFINNFMFKKDYVKEFYKKISIIENYNKLFDIYLIMGMMKYMTSFKYDLHVFGITIFNESYRMDNEKSKSFYGLNSEMYFDKAEFDELKSYLENDNLNISKDVINFIEPYIK